MGIVALVKIHRSPNLKGNGFAIAGLIIGALITLAIIIFILLGVVAYFGVLSPNKMLPERCTGPAGLDCIEKASALSGPDTISIVLKNNLGYDMTINSIEGSNPQSATCLNVGEQAGIALKLDGVEVPLETVIPNAEPMVLTVYCSKDIEAGDQLSQDLKISYTTSSEVTNEGALSIRGKIQ